MMVAEKWEKKENCSIKQYLSKNKSERNRSMVVILAQNDSQQHEVLCLYNTYYTFYTLNKTKNLN